MLGLIGHRRHTVMSQKSRTPPDTTCLKCRNRPDTALLDSMTIRARIPAAVAQSCSVVSSNPLLQLGRDPPSGSGQLTIQLQSDFQTAKLPLDLCASDGEAVVSRLLQQLNTKKSEGSNV